MGCRDGVLERRKLAMPSYPLPWRRRHFSIVARRAAAFLVLSVLLGGVCAATNPNDVQDFMPLARPGIAPLEQGDVNMAFGLDLRPALRVLYLSDHKKTVTLIDGEAEATLSFTLLLEQGFNLSRYTTKVSCSHEDTLRPDDVTIGPPMTLNRKHANFTVSTTFERSVGVTKLSITFLREDGSVYATVLCDYIVVGMSFFHVYPGNNSKVIVPPAGLVFNSYKDVLKADLIVFYCKIQFPDGSSTFTQVSDVSKRFSLSSIHITTSGSHMIAPQVSNDCPTARGSIGASGRMGLAKMCSFGFSSQYPQTNLQFGVRLTRYCAGTAVFKFRWADLTSEVGDEEEYETSLTITVNGESPPTVLSVSPQGPFRRGGGELLTCTLGNVDADDSFSFRLRNASLPMSGNPAGNGQNRTAVVSFLTPPGEGQDIPWEVYVSPKRSQILTKALWEGYDGRFNFSYRADELWIVSISPSRGTVDGGIPVSLVGNFTMLQKSNSSENCVFIDDFSVERRYMASVTSEKIVFTLPAKNVTRVRSSAVKVSVQFRGHRSNEMGFLYWEDPRITGMVQWTIGVMVSLLMTVLMATLTLCCCGVWVIKKRSGKEGVVQMEGTGSHIDRDHFGRNMDADSLVTPRSYVDRLVENFASSSMLHAGSPTSPGTDFADDGGDEVVFSAVGLERDDCERLRSVDAVE